MAASDAVSAAPLPVGAHRVSSSLVVVKIPRAARTAQSSERIDPLQPQLRPHPERLETAILETIAYADVFDYAVTAEEIHRYLVACPADLASVKQTLATSLLPKKRVESRGGYVVLPGRQALFSLRQKRAAIAQSLWRQARRYGAWIARLPFVRMVAVTGALAVDNVEQDADIDYLIVTEPGRLWLCRALVIALVRWAERRGHMLCPNYFLAERALRIDERNLYTAREVAQMVPLSGLATYRHMRRLNSWVDDLLPNAVDAPGAIAPLPAGTTTLGAGIEGLLRTPIGEMLEQWEMRRKIPKLQRRQGKAASPGEAAFCADWCKGHFEGHGRYVLQTYAQRLEQLSGQPMQQEPIPPER